MKITVEREVEDLDGAELLNVYDHASDANREGLRAELLRRLTPPTKPKRAAPVLPGMKNAKKGA